MKTFEYTSPATIDEALAQLSAEEDGATRPLAGGTDLLTLMKAEIDAPFRLVNIKRLDGLESGIREVDGGLTFGALTSLTEIERSPAVRERYPVLAEAAEVAATPQLRNMATLGGNLLQRPRCWYFRNPRFHCWLKGGAECPACDGENQLHALFGGGPCYAVHPSDLAPALLALEAEVRVRGTGGDRTLPVRDLFAPPEEDRRRETTIGSDELVLSIRVPALPDGTRSTYLKAMDRKIWAFALVSAAAVIRLDGERVEEARLALGGVAPVPWRVSEAEALLKGQRVSPELFDRAAEAALADADPLAHNGYKIPLAKALVRRALQSLAAGPTWP